jgi:beta-N-acetylhexosaminidase
MTKQITKRFLLLLFVFVFQFSIAQDSLDIKIGQMILIGLPSTQVDANVLEAVRTGKVGSILLFEKNIPAKNSYIELKKVFWTYQKAATIPLFIAIDQEGGRVNRLKEKYGFPRSVSAAKLGKYAIDSVQFYSQITATTLAGLGFNVNFAPVVDLASNPDNPIIAKPERSFSAKADSVTLFASEVIKQHRKAGVITVLKHFPGHGSSKGDTHLDVTDVTKTWNEAELIPYQSLLDSGNVDAIMTAHIVNKTLDEKGLPGTLSKKITTGILREKLHYNGVVFSDDLQMHAITKQYQLEESIQLAINAGVDILLFSNNIPASQERTVDKVHGIIRKLVENGTISRERIDQSFNRIMELKGRLSDDSEFYVKQLAKAKQEATQQRMMAEENSRLAQAAEQQATEKVKKMEKEMKSEKKKKKKKD